MKKSTFEIPDSPLLETARRLNRLVNKPEWIKVIERQQQWLNAITPMTPMSSKLTEYANLASRLPHSVTGLSGLAAGLKTYNYLLDISDFNPNEHIAGIQAMLTSVADSLSVRTPHLYEALNIPALNAMECETATLMKASGIDTQFAMRSLEISDTLQNLTTLYKSILPQIDEALAESRLVKDYTSLVERQHIQIQKDVKCSTVRLKVIEIATDLLQDHMASAVQYAESESGNESVAEEIPLNHARTGIQFIPSYLGYTFRENAGYDLDEEFAKSMVSKIWNSGKEIPQKIEYINELCMTMGKESIFKPTTKTYTSVQCLLTSFSADNTTFGCVIDSLYMLLYEGSGSAKRILEVLPDADCTVLWNIKHIRTDFRHDIEHGDEKKYLKKKRQIGCAYQAICGKPRPLKQKDWVTAHSELFTQVNEFLQSIMDILSAAREVG